MSEHFFEGFEEVEDRSEPFSFETDCLGSITSYNNSVLSEELDIMLDDSDIGRSISDYIGHWPLPEPNMDYLRGLYKELLDGRRKSFEVHSDISFIGDDDFRHVHLSAGKTPEGTITQIRDETPLTKKKREMEDYADSLQHDILSPFTTMGMSINRIIKKSNDPALKESFGIIWHQIIRIEDVTKANVKLFFGKRPEREVVSLYDDIIAHALDYVPLHGKKIRINYDWSLRDEVIYTDPSLLRLVYINLFSNAVKYTDEGGEISFGIKDNGDEWLLNVYNTGKPISDDDIKSIFKKGYRTDDAIDKETGKGEGLYTCRRVASRLGERVYAEPGRSEGVNFYMTAKKMRAERLVYDLGLLSKPVLAPVGR